jgi:2-polyprenyl-3-methyl-5-hydroxy-6-metoxy-1,4-benzoquinol methylase
MNEHQNCIVCNSKEIPNLTGYENAYLCQCQSCGLVFSKKIPTAEELEKYYKNYGINNYLSPITIKRYNQILDKLEVYRKTNKLLDVGCGIGFFLVEAKKRGWEVYGTELSEASAKICSEKGILIQNGILNSENYSPESFDVITSFEVIEHINNPIPDLRNFYTILRKGGLVYITTPNFNSLLRYKLKGNYNIITYPEHLSYYTSHTLNKAFSLSGFKKLRIETTGISLTRFKTSKGQSDQKMISAKSDDERIRTQMDSNWYLKFIKQLINTSLTNIGKGDSIKGWFIKP